MLKRMVGECGIGDALRQKKGTAYEEEEDIVGTSGSTLDKSLLNHQRWALLNTVDINDQL